MNSYFFDRYHFNSYRGGRYGGGNNWAHNPDHRRGVAYSNNRVANSFGGSTRGGNRGDNRFAGGRTSGSSGGFSRGGFNGGSASGTSRGFNGSTGGQSGGQRFSTQRDSSSFRGSNQFNANRSQAVPSQSQVAPSQVSRFRQSRAGERCEPGWKPRDAEFPGAAHRAPATAGHTSRLVSSRAADPVSSDPIRAGRAFRLLPRIARRPRLKPKAAQPLQAEGRRAATEEAAAPAIMAAPAVTAVATEVVTVPARVVRCFAESKARPAGPPGENPSV